MIQLAHTDAMEELDYRESDGIAVSLLWSRDSNHLNVVVEDRRVGESFALACRADNALEVFHHPYAYAPAQLCAAA
jgi:hypothetical protein